MNGLAEFALDEDQQMICAAAEDFLSQSSTSAAVRAAMESAAGYDPALWRSIGAEMGWCSTHIPESCGGLGLSYIELTLILERMGQHLLCAPFFATVCMAATTLLEVTGEGEGAATRRAYLAQIAAGELTATLALADTGIDWAPSNLNCAARSQPGGHTLTGSFRHVPDGASASLLLVPARLEDGTLALFGVAAGAAGLQASSHPGMDRTRRVAEVRLENAAGVLLAAGDDVERGMPRACALAAILLAAEQLGGAQRCLDLTLAYTAERKQFGRTVNGFQAVKHRCAEMMIKIEATRSAIFGAARVANTAPDTGTLMLEAACAKAFASDAFYFCAQEAIQLHGGVGFTWEYDPHLYFKRAQAGNHWLGSIDALRERAAAALLDHASGAHHAQG
jgi:alkylation response protein AidB-like acyl-CoA dehydrogenase